MEGQGFFELLDRVYATGEPLVGHAMAVQRSANRGPSERVLSTSSTSP